MALNDFLKSIKSEILKRYEQHNFFNDFFSNDIVKARFLKHIDQDHQIKQQ